VCARTSVLSLERRSSLCGATPRGSTDHSTLAGHNGTGEVWHLDTTTS